MKSLLLDMMDNVLRGLLPKHYPPVGIHKRFVVELCGSLALVWRESQPVNLQAMCHDQQSLTTTMNVRYHLTSAKSETKARQ
jgi:hypothetical protein